MSDKKEIKLKLFSNATPFGKLITIESLTPIGTTRSAQLEFDEKNGWKVTKIAPGQKIAKTTLQFSKDVALKEDVLNEAIFFIVGEKCDYQFNDIFDLYKLGDILVQNQLKLSIDCSVTKK